MYGLEPGDVGLEDRRDQALAAAALCNGPSIPRKLPRPPRRADWQQQASGSSLRALALESTGTVLSARAMGNKVWSIFSDSMAPAARAPSGGSQASRDAGCAPAQPLPATRDVVMLLLA